MPFSFRTKLTFWYVLLLATLLAAAAVFLILILQRIAERKLDATLWVLGATEAEGIAARMRDRQLQSPDDLTINDIDYRNIPGYEQFPVQKYVTVVNAAHRVADFSVNLPSDSPLPINDWLLTRALRGSVIFETINVPQVGRVRMIYTPVINHQTEPFVVIVAVPTEFVGVEVGYVARRVGAIILLVLALAGVSGWLLARRALRPVVETTTALRRINDQNLHERLAEPHTRDEIGNLIAVLNELLTRLDNAFDMQRRFTADASHEICTPLTILKGSTEVALLEPRTTREYEALLRSNLEEIERVSELTSNLLALARADSGETQTARELLIFNELVADVHARLLPLAEERGIEFTLKSNELVLVEGDHQALRQVVFNLASNALRYTPRGGRIELAVALTADNFARLDVTDTGIGIPASALPHVFDRFFRADNARAHAPEGSGLGLAICQAVAKTHGGKISVESVEGRGSRFTLFLPATQT
jgi:two-component system OmpR family sensor kinase